MTIIVGCPVAHRAWILPQWFDYVEAACHEAHMVPEYAFVVDPADPCYGIIKDRAPGAHIVEVPCTRGGDIRQWGPKRYSVMVDLRNQLLDVVRAQDPPLFLSLDSDILLHPHALSNMVEDLRFDAVGSKCFMSKTGTRVPSWGRIAADGSLRRSDADGVFGVDVIMAIKLMTRPAYHIDYELHLAGEDLGWSNACRREGLRLGWDGRVASKHVLEPYMSDQIDPRVGY